MQKKHSKNSTSILIFFLKKEEIKPLGKLRIELLNQIKNIYKNNIAIIILNGERLNILPLSSEISKKVHFCHFY